MTANIRFLVDPEKVRQRWANKHATSPLVGDTLAATEQLRNELEAAWSQQPEIVSSIETITGLPVVGDFVVFVLPPNLEEAQYIDAKTIEWGRGDSYSNSMVIGIAHELVHCITHDFYSSLSDDEKWFFHAIIYLSADEEVRFEINGKSEYFDMPTISGYHERLIKNAKALLPYWKQRMNNPRRENIINFFAEIKEKVS